LIRFGIRYICIWAWEY